MFSQSQHISRAYLRFYSMCLNALLYISKECFEHMTDLFTLFFRSHLCIGRKGFRRSYVRASKSAKFSKQADILWKLSSSSFSSVMAASSSPRHLACMLSSALWKWSGLKITHVILAAILQRTRRTPPVKNLLALCFSVFHLDALGVFEWRWEVWYNGSIRDEPSGGVFGHHPYQHPSAPWQEPPGCGSNFPPSPW